VAEAERVLHTYDVTWNGLNFTSGIALCNGKRRVLTATTRP